MEEFCSSRRFESTYDLVAAAYGSADPWTCHAALRRLDARLGEISGGASGYARDFGALELLAERVECGASPCFLFDVAALLCRLAAPPRVLEGVSDPDKCEPLTGHVILASELGTVGAGRLAAALCTAAAGGRCWHAMARALKAVAQLLRVADDGAWDGADACRVHALRLAARDGVAAALRADPALGDPCAAICARRAVKLGVRVSQALPASEMGSLWPVARERAEELLRACPAASAPVDPPPLHGLHRGACVRAGLETLFAARGLGTEGDVNSVATVLALALASHGLVPHALARELLYADAALLSCAARACELVRYDPALAGRLEWTAGLWIVEAIEAVSSTRCPCAPVPLCPAPPPAGRAWALTLPRGRSSRGPRRSAARLPRCWTGRWRAWRLCGSWRRRPGTTRWRCLLTAPSPYARASWRLWPGCGRRGGPRPRRG